MEWVITWLVNGLRARGHHITLVTVGDSQLPADNTVVTYQEAPYARLGEMVPELLHAVEAYENLDGCDIIHDHTLAGPAIAGARQRKALATVHGPLDAELIHYYRLHHSVRYIAISDAQRASGPELAWEATIHNAVDTDQFPYREDKEQYFAFLGRMNKDKGVEQAILMAREIGLPLRIAAKLNERAEYEYFETHVRPHLGPETEYLGELCTYDKLELLAGAKALLAPIQWDEPFGMTFIESLACGTPVVAIARGSVPEIIKNGTTGITGKDIDMLIHAVKAKLDLIDPAACRKDAEQRFGVDTFIDAHEQVYTKSCLAS